MKKKITGQLLIQNGWTTYNKDYRHYYQFEDLELFSPKEGYWMCKGHLQLFKTWGDFLGFYYKVKGKNFNPDPGNPPKGKHDLP